MLSIEISNEQSLLTIDEDRLRRAVQLIANEAGIRRGEISLALVDDPTIHRLNREFLEHDYATDVLSFQLEREGDLLEGEVIASTDTAERNAAEFGWAAADELLLYVIHGTLHLVGYDDQSDELQDQMRVAERKVLAAFGLEPRY